MLGTFNAGSPATVNVEPLSVALFHVPQTLLGGIGVGGTLPHCQSPARLPGSVVISVTYSDGAIGRPLASVVAQPNSGPDVQAGGAGVALTVHATPSSALTPSRSACSSL